MCPIKSLPNVSWCVFQAYRLLILKNRVELAQFQNSAPQYLTLSADFWKALSSLPLTYDYSAYRQVLQTFGTHYMSEGSLGGEYQGLLEFDFQAHTSHSKDLMSEYCYRIANLKGEHGQCQGVLTRCSKLKHSKGIKVTN